MSRRRGAAVAVAGLGRCGSTMVMRMLAAGGVPMIRGADPFSGERPGPLRLNATRCRGRAVKVLDHVGRHHGLPTGVRWQAIWLDREPRAQASSILRVFNPMMRVRLTTAHLIGVDPVETMARTLVEDRPGAIEKLEAAHADLWVMSFEEILADPLRQAEVIAERLDPSFEFDPQLAAAVVRQRAVQGIRREVGE